MQHPESALLFPRLPVFESATPLSPNSYTLSLTLKADQSLQHGKEKQSSSGVPCSGAKLCEHTPLAPHLPLATRSFLYPLQSPITLF